MLWWGAIFRPGNLSRFKRLYFVEADSAQVAEARARGAEPGAKVSLARRVRSKITASQLKTASDKGHLVLIEMKSPLAKGLRGKKLSEKAIKASKIKNPGFGAELFDIALKAAAKRAVALGISRQEVEAKADELAATIRVLLLDRLPALLTQVKDSYFLLAPDGGSKILTSAAITIGEKAANKVFGARGNPWARFHLSARTQREWRDKASGQWARTPRRSNPARATLIGRRALALEYADADKARREMKRGRIAKGRAGLPWRHTFKSAGGVYGLVNGDVLIKAGSRRLWGKV